MKTISEMIEVMQAFENGEQIEVTQTNDYNWQCSDGPSWDWWECDYRIKPKPREIWVNIYDDGGYGASYKTKEQAEFNVLAAGKTTEFREVMEGES